MSDDFMDRFKKHRDAKHAPRRDSEARREQRLTTIKTMMEPLYNTIQQLHEMELLFVGGDYKPVYGPRGNLDGHEGNYRRPIPGQWAEDPKTATINEIKAVVTADKMARALAQAIEFAQEHCGLEKWCVMGLSDLRDLGSHNCRRLYKALNDYKNAKGNNHWAEPQVRDVLCYLAGPNTQYKQMIETANTIVSPMSRGVSTIERMGFFPPREHWRHVSNGFTMRVAPNVVIGVRAVFLGPNDNASWDQCRAARLYRYEILDAEPIYDWRCYDTPAQRVYGEAIKEGVDLSYYGWQAVAGLDIVNEWFASQITKHEHTETTPEELATADPDAKFDTREQRVIDLGDGP